MMLDEYNRILALDETEQRYNTSEMAHFLRTTGPALPPGGTACASSRCDLSSAARSEHRNKRKKLMEQLPPMFGRKKKDSLDLFDSPSSRMVEDMIAPLVVQRTAAGGAKYFQIIAPRAPADRLEDVHEVRMSGELFRPSSQGTGYSRSTTNLGAVDTEDMHNFFDTFKPVLPDSHSDKENEPVLQAKAFPGLITQAERLNAKGPSLISSTGNTHCDFGLSAFERLNTRAVSPIDWSELTARASLMNVDDKSPRKQLVPMPSLDELTTASAQHSSRPKRPRSEELPPTVEGAASTDSMEIEVRPRRGQHKRELSVLDLDVLKNNLGAAADIDDAPRKDSETKPDNAGRERTRPSRLLLIDPSLSAESSFDSQAETIVPELDRGLSSSEESFTDMPKTPTPSPKVRRQPKFRLTPTPSRQNIRNSTQINANGALHFSYPYAPVPARPTAKKTAGAPAVRPATSNSSIKTVPEFPVSKFMRNACPAPSMPLPPTPPRTASPPQRSNSQRSAATTTATLVPPPSQRSSMASTIATIPRSSRHNSAARLAAQLESVTHEKELLQAALNAVLLTNGKLNKCPCSLKSHHTPSSSADSTMTLHHHGLHQQSPEQHKGDMISPPTPVGSPESSTATLAQDGEQGKVSRPTSLSASAVLSRAKRHSDSAASVLSTGSSVSALEVYMGTRMEPESAQWRGSELTITN